MRNKIKKFTEQKADGVGVIEIILIIVVIIALVIIFRDQIKGIVTGILDRIKQDVTNI